MLDLPGFVVLEGWEVAGEVELRPENSGRAMGCSGSGVRPRSKGGRHCRDVT